MSDETKVPSTASTDAMPRTFEYLLNAMEAAAQAHNPHMEGYAEKRRAVFQHVEDLWADYIRLLREKQDRLTPSERDTVSKCRSALVKAYVNDDDGDAEKQAWNSAVTQCIEVLRTLAPSHELFTDNAEAAFEKWWQKWRDANNWSDTQRMREAARAVYVEIAYSPITAAAEKLAAQGHLVTPSSRPSTSAKDDLDAFMCWEGLSEDFCLDQIFMSTDGVPDNPFESEDTRFAFDIWRAARASARSAPKKPVAWLHRHHTTAYVITDTVKNLWVKAGRPEHVENYVVPLVFADSFEASTDGGAKT